MDFKDDVHLAAAVAKNKQMFLGKKLSVARSNPKQGKRESLAHTAPGGKQKGYNFTLSFLSLRLLFPFAYTSQAIGTDA